MYDTKNMATRQEKLAQHKERWTNVTWDEMAAYIGPNADAYKKAWQRTHDVMTEKGKPGFNFNWSWAALIPILGIPWAAARKQWLFVGLMVAVVVLINVLYYFFPKAGNFSFMPFLVAWWAKEYYTQAAVAKISEIKATIPEGTQRDAAIRAAGGIDMSFGYIAGAICAVLILLAALTLI